MRIIQLPFEPNEIADAVWITCPLCGLELLVARDGWRDRDGCDCTRFLWMDDDLEFYNEERWDKDEFMMRYTMALTHRLLSRGRPDGFFLGLPDLDVLGTMTSPSIELIVVLRNEMPSVATPYGALVVWALGETPMQKRLRPRRKERALNWAGPTFT